MLERSSESEKSFSETESLICLNGVAGVTTMNHAGFRKITAIHVSGAL
jgi:hypothetical protein